MTIPLDVHAHLSTTIGSQVLRGLNACVVAMTRTPLEYSGAAYRSDANTVWALGCHPCDAGAHSEFTVTSFERLSRNAPVIGEVGLDGSSPVPLDTQYETFLLILRMARDLGRVVSIHGRKASRQVLTAIEALPSPGLILHWWSGTQAEAREAIALGCFFSINPSQSANTRLLRLLPPERVLTETDHPYGDKRHRQAAKPGDVRDIEAALATIWSVDVADVRNQVWSNFLQLARLTGTAEMFPPVFREQMLTASPALERIAMQPELPGLLGMQPELPSDDASIADQEFD